MVLDVVNIQLSSGRQLRELRELKTSGHVLERYSAESAPNLSHVVLLT